MAKDIPRDPSNRPGKSFQSSAPTPSLRGDHLGSADGLARQLNERWGSTTPLDRYRALELPLLRSFSLSSR